MTAVKQLVLESEIEAMLIYINQEQERRRNRMKTIKLKNEEWNMIQGVLNSAKYIKYPEELIVEMHGFAQKGKTTAFTESALKYINQINREIETQLEELK